MASNYGEAPSEPEKGGFLDKDYLKGIPAIIKAVEVLGSLIAFICVTADPAKISLHGATFGYFKFVSMTAFICTLILWLVLLFKFHERVLKCNCVWWSLWEFSFYCGVDIFYFFGDLFLSLHAIGGGHKAGCAFGWVALGAYGVDTFFAFRKFWEDRKTRGQPATQATVTVTELQPPVKY